VATSGGSLVRQYYFQHLSPTFMACQLLQFAIISTAVILCDILLLILLINDAVAPFSLVICNIDSM